jgi:hypothetical protein
LRLEPLVASQDLALARRLKPYVWGQSAIKAQENVERVIEEIWEPIRICNERAELQIAKLEPLRTECWQRLRTGALRYAKASAVLPMACKLDCEDFGFGEDEPETLAETADRIGCPFPCTVKPLPKALIAGAGGLVLGLSYGLITDAFQLHSISDSLGPFLVFFGLGATLIAIACSAIETLGVWLGEIAQFRSTNEKNYARLGVSLALMALVTVAVDDLAKALGASGVSKSEVSRLVVEIDERVQAFLNRPLEGDFPYVWLDATYVKAREGGRIIDKAAVVAIGLSQAGKREVLGMAEIDRTKLLLESSHAGFVIHTSSFMHAAYWRFYGLPASAAYLSPDRYDLILYCEDLDLVHKDGFRFLYGRPEIASHYESLRMSCTWPRLIRLSQRTRLDLALEAIEQT